MRALLLGRHAALKVVIALAQEVQLQLVTLDGLIAAHLAVLLFLTAALADGLALVVGAVVVVGSAYGAIILIVVIVFIVLRELALVLDNDDVFIIIVVFTKCFRHRSSPFR